MASPKVVKQTDAADSFCCTNCSTLFSMEHRLAGPKACPGCGERFALTPEELLGELLRVSLKLGLDPTTLLYLLRIFAVEVLGR